MKQKKHIINRIIPGSIAEELEIEVGDILLAIDNTEIEDIFDYQFLIQDTYIEVLIEKADGEQWLLEVDKEFDEDLGVEFETSLIDKPRSCKNKCIFCFIDQLPKGLRKPLYFKDDDTRLSFLTGNFKRINVFYKSFSAFFKASLKPSYIPVVQKPKLFRRVVTLDSPFLIKEYIFPKITSAKSIKIFFHKNLNL